nr:MAG TPA: hypothetical protein [Caudoviricetes sp.]
MVSNNPTYGLWNEGEDEVKSSKKYGVRALDTKTEEAIRANRVHECITYHADTELLKKGIIRKVED